LLPRLIANTGQIVFITSTAAETPYEGGAGYCGAKAAERMVAGAMRLGAMACPVLLVLANGMALRWERDGVFHRLKGGPTWDVPGCNRWTGGA
jgi:NAD(P)-dependent dehydrogenase (short-subunit alcohol dehydrogenase family)